MAYSSLPTRIAVASSSETTVASTFSRGSPGLARSRATAARIVGSALANSTMRSNLVSSRIARQRLW